MKLRATDWKTAWFESHISERFFQEMARLEKGPVQSLQSTGQWMEQVMIDMGALAQAMIRLEQDGAPEPRIRQAGEKCLRLAALALHLITALDGADREQLRPSALVRSEQGEWLNARPPLQLPGTPGAAIAPGEPQVRAPMAPPVPLFQRRAASPPPTEPAPAPEEADDAAAPPAEPDAPADSMAPRVAALLQVAGRGGPRPESHMRQTIVSLAQQGLSRAEIETVTGEPRHVIEAILNQSRAAIQAGA